MTRPDYWHPRPYVDGQRFTGGGKYWRPDLHLTTWYYLPPAVKAATLAGLRVWQAMTATDDEIGCGCSVNPASALAWCGSASWKRR